MAELVGKFNSGGTTSSTIDRQFTPEFVTKAVVEVPKRKRHFSLHSTGDFPSPDKSVEDVSRRAHTCARTLTRERTHALERSPHPARTRPPRW